MKKLGMKTGLFALCGIFVGGFVLVLGMTLATRLMSWPLYRQNINLNSTSDQNYFSAEGKAVVNSVPDEVTVNLGVTQTEKTVEIAQAQVNQTIENIKTNLQNLGVEKQNIQTQNYSVYPSYDWSQNVEKIVGYTVSTDLEVKLTDFDLLNQVIDVAASNGANQIGGVNFSLSETKQEELKKEARQEAIAQAKSNAQELAQLTGIKLDRIINVYEYTDSDTNANLFSSKMAVAEDAAAGTTIEAGEASYTYHVNLTYSTN
ncbi:MAG: SIMPL domain-containing protein [bacterium]|nr:SIMPL domain-containing protein [bacterium]